MDPALKAGIETSARTLNLEGVDPSFYERLEHYMARVQRDGERVVGRKLSAQEHRVVEGYIAYHALHVAKVDGKPRAQADDVKSAIWFFHTPVGVNDTCVESVTRILEIDNHPTHRQLLSEGFRSFMEERRERKYPEWGGGMTTR